MNASTPIDILMVIANTLNTKDTLSLLSTLKVWSLEIYKPSTWHLKYKDSTYKKLEESLKGIPLVKKYYGVTDELGMISELAGVGHDYFGGGVYISLISIQSITIRHLINITHLTFYECNLESINVAALVNLVMLNLENNKLVEVELSTLTNLTNLFLNMNHIDEIDVSTLVNLKALAINRNPIYKLDISNLNLISIYISTWTRKGLVGRLPSFIYTRDFD